MIALVQKLTVNDMVIVMLVENITKTMLRSVKEMKLRKNDERIKRIQFFP